MIESLHWASAVFAAGAAAFWLASAFVKIPTTVTVSFGGGGNTGIELTTAMRNQSRLSAAGAFCAAVSAAAQATVLLI